MLVFGRLLTRNLGNLNQVIHPEQKLLKNYQTIDLDSEYIKLARAKGVGNSGVIWRHAFRNALIPPLTFSALILVGFIGGTVVTETVFAWPGLGQMT